ncbi:tetratricopeptide repeat protein [Bradyrhizobium sp. CCGB12]|uniref:tetratricopeptide repeat protein n=1 Tax=Bradyrhizobium sp. CCGB12 TaxID=2949632 RepID=UPI0020B3850D|nr:tetratricopeptide repeat protein [Bradyrhizobium sp. CCGB12]MCP3393964.1 tetratricopeptide repeat protein [Bradyrhizobium sp. CCGB12]
MLVGLSRKSIYAIVSVCVIGAAGHAQAPSQEWLWCSGKKSTTLDRRIESCNSLIDSPDVAPANKSLAYCNRAVAYQELGDMPRAISDLEESVRLDTEKYPSLICRAHHHYFMGNTERAIAGYSEAIASNPRQPEAFVARGVVYRSIKEFDRAIADYDEAIRLAPDDALAYANRADAHLQIQRYDQSMRDFNDAIRLDPNMTPAYAGRAKARAALGSEPPSLDAHQ